MLFVFRSHGFSVQIDAMGVRDQSVEDRVGDGGFPDDFVPVFDLQLAGDDCGAPSLPVLDHFE